MRLAQIIPLFFTGVITLAAESLVDIDNSSIGSYFEKYSFHEKIYTAENALKFGLYDSAAQIYENIIYKNEEDPSLLLTSSGISLDSIRLSLIRALIGKRDFSRAAEILNQVNQSNKQDSFYLYRLIVDYFLNYDFSKKEQLNLIREAFKELSPEFLTESERVWYYYFLATIDLLENKKSSIKHSLFLAERFSVKNLSQQSFFESLLLRLDYNHQKPDNSIIKRLGKLLKSKENKNESYHYAYDYAYLLALRGDKNLALEIINSQLDKGDFRYSSFELDNLRLLKVIVLGPNNNASRDLLFTLIQSSNDTIILGRSFQLLERYIYKNEDEQFLAALSRYFDLQKVHPLRSKFFFLKANLSLIRIQESIDKNDLEERFLALEQLNIDANYILENFPATNSLREIYQMLTYVSLNQEEPQYRLAAGYLSQILVFSDTDLEKLQLNNFIGSFYFLNGDYEVASDSYQDALLYRDLLDSNARGQLWFSLLTAQIRSNAIDKKLFSLVKNEANLGLIPFEYYLKIQWNHALSLRVIGEIDSAISVVESTINTERFNSLPISLGLQFKWLTLYLKNLSGKIDRELISDADSLISEIESSNENHLEKSLSTKLLSQARLLKAQLLIRLKLPNEGFTEIESLQNDFPQTQASQQSYIILANYYANLEEYGLAEKVLLELADLYPESDYAPQALLEAAINLGKLGSDRYRQAIELLGQLVKNYDSSPIVYFALRHQGDLLRKASDFSAALSVYDSLIQKYPNHTNRYLAELSRLDCMLALANDQSNYEFKEIILQLERLLDLPNLPSSFRYEVIYKLAFLWVKVEEGHLSKALILEQVAIVLGNVSLVEEMTEIDRYWLSRSFFLLSELLKKDGNEEESKKIYRLIISYNLPGTDLAKELLQDI